MLFACLIHEKTDKVADKKTRKFGGEYLAIFCWYE